MVTLDQKDCERIGKSVAFHLKQGETELCMTLLKTLQLAQESGAVAPTVASQIPRIFTKIAQEARETLTCQRKEMEERQFQGAFALYEQCLLLSMQATVAQPSGVQDVYYNPNEVAERVVMSTQDNTGTGGGDVPKVIRPFGGEHAIPVS